MAIVKYYDADGNVFHEHDFVADKYVRGSSDAEGLARTIKIHYADGTFSVVKEVGKND